MAKFSSQVNLKSKKRQNKTAGLALKKKSADHPASEFELFGENTSILPLHYRTLLF